MKVICINISNRKKHNKNKLRFTSLNLKQDCNSFWELTIPLDLLNKRVFEYNKGIFSRIKGIIWDRTLISKIKSKDNESFFILPKLLEKQFTEGTAMDSLKSHIMFLMNKAGVRLYTYSGDIKNNIQKYIDQELEKQKVPLREAKLILLHEDIKNIDYTLIQELVEKYKTIDILCKTGDRNIVDKKIEKINNTLGCSIVVKNKITKKDLKISGYHIGLCMDANRNKIGLNGITVIDLYDNDIDKYDKYAIMANKNKLYKNINSEYLAYMSKNYGRLKILSLLCKMENLA